MRSRIALVAFTLLIAGCMPKAYLPPPGATAEDGQRQLAKCKMESETLVTNLFGAPFSSPARRKYIVDCMRAQGYIPERAR